MVARSSSRTPPDRRARLSRTGYLEQTQRPLNCLLFLLPILIVYELGILLAYPSFSPEAPAVVKARSLLLWFMSLFGVTGYHLPGLIVVVVLLGWHVLRRDPWRFNRGALLGMAGESLLLPVPPVLGYIAVAGSLPLAAGAAESAARVAANSPLGHLILLSMSAGIYEELVFRLLFINLLVFLLADVANLKRGWASAVAILVSSLVFALHHYKGFGGGDPFLLLPFVFRASLGVYLAGIFVLRGFGIAVGCHTVYDIIAISMAQAGIGAQTP